MDLFSAGIIAGMIATLVMSLIEIPSWKRWGLYGVFEWHENQIIWARLFRKPVNIIHFKGIYFFHFLNGTLGGLAFLFILSFSIVTMTMYPVVIIAIFYGFVLWIVTLVPIHKPITGYSPWNHELGHLPAILSLFGHLVYGLVLGIITLFLVTN
jgi:hypothetical protein